MQKEMKKKMFLYIIFDVIHFFYLFNRFLREKNYLFGLLTIIFNIFVFDKGFFIFYEAFLVF
jgi:hypothetical protein